MHDYHSCKEKLTHYELTLNITKNMTGGNVMYTGWNEFDRFFGAMGLMRNRCNYVFGDIERRYGGVPAWRTVVSKPRTNIHDSGDDLRVVAELPGIDKEDLSIKIQGNHLEIKGSQKTDTLEGYRTHRKERGGAALARSFTLPYEVDAEKVSAELKDGVLTMILPKADAAKAKQITVH